MSPITQPLNPEEDDGDEVAGVTYADQVMTTSNVLRLRSRRRCPELTPVVMAAGYGSQMFELTENLPKCMLPVANIPMIWYPVNYLIQHHFEEIFVVVRVSARDKIEHFLTTQFRKQSQEVHFEFVCIEDDNDFGTADSLRLLTPKTKSDLLVISSDLITKASLSALANVHRANNAAITALVAPRYTAPNAKSKKRNKKDDRDFIGLDPTDDRMLFISNEKDVEDEISISRGQLSKFPHMRLHTNMVDSHLYVVSRTALDILDNHPSISMMRCELLPLLVRKQIKQIVNAEEIYSDRLYSTHQPSAEEEAKHPDTYFDVLLETEKVGCYVHRTSEFTVRVNQLHNYMEYNRAVSENMGDTFPKSDDSPSEISKMTQVGKCSRIGDKVKIGERCGIEKSFIGNGVQIGPHCKISGCVVMEDVVIEDNVSLFNCVVCPDAVIASKSNLKDCRVCSKFEVAAGTELTGETLNADSHDLSFNIGCSSGVSSDADSCHSK